MFGGSIAAEMTAIWLSLRIALAATIASLPFGIFVAYALARWRFPGKIILNAAVHLPLVMPPDVIEFVLLVLFGRKDVFGVFLANAVSCRERLELLFASAY
jgi:molybdate transport system permease protein